MSSSSSSFQYSSSSSSSLAFSSSSSSGYCQYPECIGTACEFFTTWYIDGLTTDIAPNGYLYVKCNYLSGNQQLEVYSDPGYLNLIAFGQSATSPIVLSERDGSGVTGYAIWDGTPCGNDISAVLACTEFS